MPESPPNTTHFLTVKQAAELEGTSIRRIRQKINTGEYATEKEACPGGIQYLINPLSLSPSGRLRYVVERLPTDKENQDLKGLDDEPAERLLLLQDAIGRLNRAERGEAQGIIKDICAKVELSRSAFYRIYKEYNKTNSLAAFLRKERSDARITRDFSPEALEFGLSEYLLVRRKGDAYAKLWAEALMQGWECGSYRAFCRFLRGRVDQDEAMSTYTEEGRKGLENRAAPTILRDMSDLEPGEWYCGDHHQFNLFIYDEKLKKVYRPWLTAWQDMCTRAVVGYVVCLQPNSRSIAQALQHALDDGDIPLGIPPSWGPWVEPRGIQVKRRHYGVPQHVYIDNGKDYKSHYISGGNLACKRFKAPDLDIMSRAVLAELHAEVTFALPFKARSKPIERWFNTLEHQFVERQPGFCGHNTAQRRQFTDYELMRQIENQELLTLEQFKGLLDEWIEKKYHESEHRGRGAGERSPNEIWDAAEAQGWAPATIGNKLILAHLFMFSTTRKSGRQGIQIHKHFYWDEVLLFILGKKVEVRWDPDDLSQIYVFKDREFVCIAGKRKYLSMKSSQEEIAEQMADQRRMVKLIEDRYASLTGGHRKAINTGSPGTWGKAIRESYGDAAEEQARKAAAEHKRRKQKVSKDLILMPPGDFYEEEIESLNLIPSAHFLGESLKN